MTDAETEQRTLEDRWSCLEQIRRRTPSHVERMSAMMEQVEIEVALRGLGQAEGSRPR